jgi:hypothetical protein
LRQTWHERHERMLAAMIPDEKASTPEEFASDMPNTASRAVTGQVFGVVR